MPYLFSYILLILLVNIAFAWVPCITLPGGELLSPVAVVVGLVYVVRDYAQRYIGHHILWAMLAGCALSWFFASPELAFASATAFAIGEITDWAVFTITRRPFSQRILVSSLIGVPLDTIVFLSLIGLATPVSILAMTLSKLIGVCFVYILVRRREQKQHQQMRSCSAM